MYLIIALLLLCAPVTARELYPGQYAQVEPAVRQWFKDQRLPNGVICCDQSDGTLAEEDIRGTHYWTRWPDHPQWMQVPEEAVIHNSGNPNGSAVVWWGGDEDSSIYIRCFVPGGGV